MANSGTDFQLNVHHNFGAEYIGQNRVGEPVPELHELLQAGLDRFNELHPDFGGEQGYTNKYGVPGSHAEVDALNQLLYGREAALGRPLTEADIERIALYNVWTDPVGASVVAGSPAPRCDICTYLTRGAIVFLR